LDAAFVEKGQVYEPNALDIKIKAVNGSTLPLVTIWMNQLTVDKLVELSTALSIEAQFNDTGELDGDILVSQWRGQNMVADVQFIEHISKNGSVFENTVLKSFYNKTEYEALYGKL
jgi:histidinol phosphatase-like PHP family hydrolase